MKQASVIVLVGFILSVVFSALLLPLLRRYKVGQPILKYVTEHAHKSGTPTMGGIAFVCAVVISGLIEGQRGDRDTAVCLIVTVGFCIVGFMDDLIKIRHSDNQGLKPYQKIFFQTAIAVLVGVYCYLSGKTTLSFPFSSTMSDIHWGIIPFIVFVFIATVNCVNLTDGLDGLAGGTSCAYLFSMGLLCVTQDQPLSVLCWSGVGALGGFLIFNVSRASCFMGDTGSLALGGLIASVSCISGNGLYIPIIGIFFVCSGLSVILQVIYYKRTGKRLFLMAPLHHHWQKKGYSEAKIAYVYAVVTLFIGLLCIVCVR